MQNSQKQIGMGTQGKLRKGKWGIVDCEFKVIHISYFSRSIKSRMTIVSDDVQYVGMLRRS